MDIINLPKTADASTAPKSIQGNIVELPTLYYAQWGASPALGDLAAETFGGWHRANCKLNLDKTALVLMHAAYCGSAEQAPLQFQYVEYTPRSYTIAANTFPPLLASARKAGIKIYHVPFGAGYFEHLPGYQKAQALGAEDPLRPHPRAEPDAVLEDLRRFKDTHVCPGPAGWEALSAERRQHMDFLPEARPVGHEPIAVTANELASAALADGVNHLIYLGFALESCLLLAEGGMHSMAARGFMCSAVLDCVTAVENRESARTKQHTATALWRVSTSYGFVYESRDLQAAFQLYIRP